jgi:hypothetical protein
MVDGASINHQQKKRLPYTRSLLYEGAKRWSFGDWLQSVIQELGQLKRLKIESTGFCNDDIRN